MKKLLHNLFGIHFWETYEIGQHTMRVCTYCGKRQRLKRQVENDVHPSGFEWEDVN